MAASRAVAARRWAARARSNTGPEPTLISTSRAAAAAAASANTTPVSASPRTAADADSATRAPSSATSARRLRHVRRRLARRGECELALLLASAPRAPGRTTTVPGRRAAALCARSALACSPVPESETIRAAISTSAAASAAPTAAELPPPGAGVASATAAQKGLERLLVEVRHAPVPYLRGDRTRPPTAFDDVTGEQVESFRRDGFLIVEEGLVAPAAVEVLRERFAALFDGDYATGIGPDEVNWKKGRDRDDVTRQICNGWRADDLIAAQVLSERTGRIAAEPRRLPRHAHAPGQLPLEAARDEIARHAPGRVLRGLPLPARDDHLLGRARRDLRPGRHDRVRPRVAPVAEGAARPRQLPCARRLAGADRRRPPRAPRSSACRWW